MIGKRKTCHARKLLAATALCAAMMFSGSAVAQQSSSETGDEWKFSGAIYLWGAGIGGHTITGSEVDVSVDSLVDSLDTAFMGALLARKNKWSLITDVIYLDLSDNKTVELGIPIGPITVPVIAQADFEVEGWVLHFSGGYELYSAGKSRLDLIGGARYLDLGIDLFLDLESIGPGQSRTITESGTAWDVILGLKGQASLGERWYLPYYVDAGTGQSKFTWNASAGIGFRASRIVDLALLYRHLEWDLDSTRVIDDINFSGPTFGVIFRW